MRATGAIALIGYDDVWVAITIDVSGRDQEYMIATRGITDRRLEGAVATADQHCHITGARAVAAAWAVVGHNQVRNGIGVDVDDHDLIRTPISARTVRDGLTESAVAVA